MGKFKDLTGKRYGKLTVVEFKEFDKHKQSKWICQCECGNTTVVYGYNLRKKRKGCKKCGVVKHGLYGHPLNPVWRNMKSRCNNPKHRSFEYYGCKGVKVYEEWSNSFQVFYDWSIEEGYEKGLCLDRINSNLGYNPENCQWLTKRDNSSKTSGIDRLRREQRKQQKEFIRFMEVNEMFDILEEFKKIQTS